MIDKRFPSSLILLIFLLYLTSYVITASEILIEHFIWYGLVSLHDRTFVHTCNTSPGKACYNAQEFSDKITTATCQTQVCTGTHCQATWLFPFCCFYKLPNVQTNIQRAIWLLSMLNFQNHKKGLSDTQQCPIVIRLQDTFIIKRRRITRVVTLRSSSELESPSLSFMSW